MNTDKVRWQGQVNKTSQKKKKTFLRMGESDYHK